MRNWKGPACPPSVNAIWGLLNVGSDRFRMQAKIIFDVATKPFAWQPVWASAGAAIFGCLLILLKRFKSRYGSRIAGYFFILSALAGTGYSLSHWYLSR